VRRADDLIQRFLDSIGQTEGAVYVGLSRSWQSIVGERIAAHAQPVDIRGHSLVVEADHPGWVQMVMMNRKRIIGEINRRFPELTISGLAVRVVDHPGAARSGAARPEQARPARDTPPSDSPDDERTPDEQDPQPPSRDEQEALTRIEDDELRDALSRLRIDLEQE
jgi:hypothetical protein